MEKMFDEMIAFQERKLLSIASEIIPNITEEDVLQPNDFPKLDAHPFFKYEEGFLKGLHSAKMAYMAKRNEEG